MNCSIKGPKYPAILVARSIINQSFCQRSDTTRLYALLTDSVKPLTDVSMVTGASSIFTDDAASLPMSGFTQL
jgi:hypothetical protein